MPDDVPEPSPVPEPVRPVTIYSRGGDLSKVPKAADTPPANLEQILGVDSSNPFLRRLRIQEGLLRSSDVPPEVLARVPLTPEILQRMEGIR
jgi:hypothetical protein